MALRIVRGNQAMSAMGWVWAVVVTNILVFFFVGWRRTRRRTPHPRAGLECLLRDLMPMEHYRLTSATGGAYGPLRTKTSLSASQSNSLRREGTRWHEEFIGVLTMVRIIDHHTEIFDLEILADEKVEDGLG